MKLKKKFSELIKKYRIRAGFDSKQSVADALNVSRTSIVYWEDPNNDRFPKDDNLSDLISLYNLNISEKQELLDSMSASKIKHDKIESLLRSTYSHMFEEDIIDIILSPENIEFLKKIKSKTPDQKKMAYSMFLTYLDGLK